METTSSRVQINDKIKTVEEVEEAVARVRRAIATVRSCERAWGDRLTELETLSLATMTKAFEDHAVHRSLSTATQPEESHLDLEKSDRLLAETALIMHRLELTPRLLQHLSEREKERVSKLQDERAKLASAESRAEYIKLRDELVASPRMLKDAEKQTFWQAALHGGYRDDFDALMSAVDLFVQHKKYGLAKGPFVRPESS